MRIAIAALAIGAAASACGSEGGGHTSGRLDVRAAVRPGACLPVHPGLSPYRGALVLVRADGRRVRVVAGPRGRGHVSLAAGSYRVVPPLAGSTLRVRLDGRALAAGHGYPLRIAGGRTAVLAVVILPRRGDCSSGGTVFSDASGGGRPRTDGLPVSAHGMRSFQRPRPWVAATT